MGIPELTAASTRPRHFAGGMNGTRPREGQEMDAMKITQYRNKSTGELSPPHRLGETEDGVGIYDAPAGWVPIDANGNEVQVECDEDGNWLAAR